MSEIVTITAQKIYNKLKSSPIPEPNLARIKIPANGQGFIPDDSYFNVTVHEIFLKDGRQWWSVFAPSIYVNTDFIYGRERLAVPCVFNPETFSAKGKQKVPHGFLINDINVVGPHPYRGDRIALTLILYAVKTENYARRTLKFAEDISSAIGVPANMKMVEQVGASVLDALETLIGMNDCVPRVGHRIEVSRVHGLEPTYFALIGGDRIDTGRLAVRDQRLVKLDDTPFRDEDFVLYSLSASNRRDEVGTLPFYENVAAMDAASLSGDADGWQRAKATLLTIYQQMLTSPDLVKRQAEEIFTDLLERMKRNRGTGDSVRLLGEGSSTFAETYSERANSALKLLATV